jgi:homoserine kinase
MGHRRAWVSVPATTANLGPGFDCLALSLDLWNEAEFVAHGGEGIVLEISGEGADTLPRDGRNALVSAAGQVFARLGRPAPGLHVRCRNRIPLGSGLGSSASAALLGLLGANALLGQPLTQLQIFDMLAQIEGHPDNGAAALYGGLVIVVRGSAGWLVQRHDLAPLRAAYVLPDFEFSTRTSRRALPQQVPLADAVFNLGRAALMVQALVSGDKGLLGQVMEDRLHQPYRLALIPGAREALDAARSAGAAAAVLSGAGPSVIAFMQGDAGPALAGMQAAFRAAGLESRALELQACNGGARVEIED